jgi:hypothetical protein
MGKDSFYHSLEFSLTILRLYTRRRYPIGEAQGEAIGGAVEALVGGTVRSVAKSRRRSVGGGMRMAKSRRNQNYTLKATKGAIIFYGS